MPATIHAPHGPWTRAPRSAVVLAALAMALVATLVLLVFRGSGPTATPTPEHASATHSPSGPGSASQRSTGQDRTRPSYVPPLQRINEGCSIAHFGVPC